MKNGHGPDGRVNLHELVMEIAAELTDAHTDVWKRDGNNNDLRRELIKAANAFGLDSAAVVPQIKQALKENRITARSTSNGLPSLNPDDVIPDTGVVRPGHCSDGLEAPNVSVLKDWYLTPADADKVREICSLPPLRGGTQAGINNKFSAAKDQALPESNVYWRRRLWEILADLDAQGGGITARDALRYLSSLGDSRLTREGDRLRWTTDFGEKKAVGLKTIGNALSEMKRNLSTLK